MPAPSVDRLWVQVRQPVSLRDLSRDLQLETSTMAELNEVEVEHRFDRGDWVVLPSKQLRIAKQLAALDTSQLRRTPPPLMTPPPVQTTGVVRLGETLLQVAQRYGTTMQELLRLNPGLETARLMAGAEVQLVQSAPTRYVLGLRPSASGGLSWPELPSPSEPAYQQRKTSSEIRAEIYRRRSAGFLAFGSCSYEWGLWRVDARGVRTTRFRCGSDDLSDNKWIAVDCKTLKVSRRYPYSSAWLPWSYPSSDDVVSMVAKLCANTVSVNLLEGGRDFALPRRFPVLPVVLIV